MEEMRVTTLLDFHRETACAWPDAPIIRTALKSAREEGRGGKQGASHQSPVPAWWVLSISADELNVSQEEPLVTTILLLLTGFCMPLLQTIWKPVWPDELSALPLPLPVKTRCASVTSMKDTCLASSTFAKSPNTA